MTAQLPILKPRQVVKALERAGFYVHHQTGSHARFFHHTHTDLRVTIPIHSKDLKRSVLKSILVQADLSSEQFKKFL